MTISISPISYRFFGDTPLLSRRIAVAYSAILRWLFGEKPVLFRRVSELLLLTSA